MPESPQSSDDWTAIRFIKEVAGEMVIEFDDEIIAALARNGAAIRESTLAQIDCTQEELRVKILPHLLPA